MPASSMADDLHAPAAPLHPDATDLIPYRDQAYLLALRILGEPADAEDAVQQAYLQVLRFGGGRPNGEAARRWFLTVAANAARRVRRQRRRRAAREVRDDQAAARQETTMAQRDADATATLKQAVADALAALDDTFRTAIAARYELGLPYGDAARVLGVPAVLLRLRVSRGLAKLRSMLARRGIAAEGATIAGVVSSGFGLGPSPGCAATVDAIANGAPPIGLKLAQASLPLAATAGWIAATALATSFAWSILPAHAPQAARAAAPPTPAPRAHERAEAFLDEAVVVDYRGDTARSIAADLSIRAGLRHGVRVLHPFPLAPVARLDVSPDHAYLVREVLQRVASATGAEIDVRDDAVLLWRHAPDGAYADLVKAASAMNAADRAAALVALADLADARACEPLAAALADPAPAVVDAALDGLARYGAALPYAIAPARIAAAIAPLVGPDLGGWRAHAAADIVAACAGPNTTALIATLRRHADPRVRARAAVADSIAAFATAPETLAALARWDDDAVGAALDATGARALGDDERRLLARAYRAGEAAIALPLCWFRVEQAQHDAAERGLEQVEADRWAATLALAARAGCDGFRERLARRLRDPDPFVRARAAMALGQTNSGAAKADLAALLDRDRDREVQRAAIWSLGILRGAPTVDVLATRLGDPDFAVAALDAMAATADPAALGLLDGDFPPKVKPAAQRVKTVLTRHLRGESPPFDPEAWRLFEVSAEWNGGEMLGWWLDRSDPPGTVSWWIISSGVERSLRYGIVDVGSRRRLWADLERAADLPSTRDYPGRAMPATAPAVGDTLCRWGNGRTSTISIGRGSGTVRPCRVVTREADGALIVSYLADAFLDGAGTLHVRGVGALSSGPRANDWSNESFAIAASGEVQMMDGSLRLQTAQVEPPAPAEAPVKRSADF